MSRLAFYSSLALAFIQTSSILAQESVPCDCAQYKDLQSTADLAADTSLVLLSALTDTGAPYKLPIEERKVLRLKIFADDIVPEHCRRSKANTQAAKQWSHTLRLTFERPVVPMAVVAPGIDIASVHSQLSAWANGACGGYGESGSGRYSGAYGTSPSSAENAPKPDFCSEQNPHARVYKYLQTEKGKHNANLLLMMGWDTSEPVLSVESRAKIVTAFYGVLAKGSEQSALAFLKTQASNFNTEEKLQLTQMFGVLFGFGYDSKRNKQGIGAKGSISLDQILQAANQNMDTFTQESKNAIAEQNGFPTDSDIPDAVRAGVCRDVASAQAQMLSALGMPNSYLLVTAVPGSYHVNVITQDPDKPRKIFKINYSGLGTSENLDASQSLFMGDSSLNYRIFRPAQGGMVAVTPSEFGKIAAESAGFDIRTIDPFARENSSMIAVQRKIRTGEHETNGRVFFGTDAVGQKYLGAGITRILSASEYAQGKLGLVLGGQNLPKEIVGSSKDRNLAFLYLQIEERLKTPDLQLASTQLRLRGEGTLTGIAALGYTVDSDVPIPQGDLRSEVGARLTYNAGAQSHSELEFSLYVGAQIAPGMKDVRDVWFTGIRPAFSYAVVSAEARKRLSAIDGAYVGVLATSVCGQIGCTGKAEADVVYRDIAVSFAAEGALTDKMAPYVSGVERRITARILYSLMSNPGLTMELSGYRSLENDNAGVIGTMKFKH